MVVPPWHAFKLTLVLAVADDASKGSIHAVNKALFVNFLHKLSKLLPREKVLASHLSRNRIGGVWLFRRERKLIHIYTDGQTR